MSCPRGVLAAGVLAALLVGCAGLAPTSAGSVCADDGVPLAFEVAGRGDPALVFVHCWACDREFWREQADVFAREHLVLSLDLAGHGASGAEREHWTLESLADDVVTVVESLGLPRVVLVGHSMGGPVSLLAAARMPGRVLGVVGVDTLHDADFRLPREVMDRFATDFEKDFAGTLERMLATMFAEGADPALVRWVAERAAAADRRAVLALLAAFPDFDLGAALAGAGVPVRCLNAAPRPERGMPTNVAGNRRHADFDARLLPGVGHYPQLERPAEFDAALRAVLVELLRAP